MPKTERQKESNRNYMRRYSKEHPYSSLERSYPLDYQFVDTSPTKVCSRCKKEKSVEQFYVMRPKRSMPYRQAFCKQCLRENNDKYHRENADKIRVAVRPRKLAMHHKRYKTDSQYKLQMCLRARVRMALGSIGKCAKTEDLVGCTIAELRLHLDRKFRQGMSWDNHGKVWHIDHIVPCNAFDLSDHEQQRMCFHFTNLQPLLRQENILKGDKVPEGAQMRMPI